MKSSLLSIACCLAVSSLLIPTHLNAAPASKDKSFVENAAQGGMTEVEAGKAAQEKGASQDVKDFGAMMVKDHSANNEELATLAKSKDIMVPDKLDSTHQGMIDKMSKLSGAAFDKAYINDMVAGHKKMLKLMKGEESSKDADLKNFATKTSETVQMHLTKAEDIQKTLK